MEELARRVVACKDWRWLAGMLLEDGRRVAGFTVDGRRSLLLCTNGHVGCFGKLTDTEVVPDLTDPATLGCLLALVREAYGFRLWLAASRDGDRWYVDAASGTLAHGKTEGEALVAALEAANG